MRIALFGSQFCPPDMQRDAIAYVGALWKMDPGATVVSGGAEGIDSCVEHEALRLGMGLISIRPYQQGDLYGAEEWSWPDFRVVRLGEPIWGDWSSAAVWRDMLIAERADRGACWHYKNSPGTWHTRDAFQAEGKQCFVYTEEAPFSSAS